MEKKTVFLTGACGGMGFQGLTRMLKDGDSYNTLVLVRDSEKNRNMLKPYMALGNLEVVWGDLNDYDTVYKCVEKSDLILHVAAFVSPQADYNPPKAMQVNYGSTKNLITAIKEQKEKTKSSLYISEQLQKQATVCRLSIGAESATRLNRVCSITTLFQRLPLKDMLSKAVLNIGYRFVKQV